VLLAARSAPATVAAHLERWAKMKKTAAILFGIISIAAVLFMLLLLFGCVGEYVAQHQCGTPLAGDIMCIMVFFPIAFLLTYRAWKFAQKNNSGTRFFRSLFIFSRALSIVAIFFLSFIFFRT
jgi:hypothetical protein